MTVLPESLSSLKAKDAKSEESASNMAKGGSSFYSVISAVNAEVDTMTVDHFDGPRDTKILHPYLGTTSWHRVGPEQGMSVIMQSLLNSSEPEASVYYKQKSRTEPNDTRIKNYNSNTDVYRPLREGEQELNSKGLAQIYLSRRPLVEIRGGTIRSWWDQDKLEHGSRAITHRMVLHKNASNLIGDEFRIGVVTRPGQSQTDSSSSKNKSYINTTFVKVNNSFAKELLYVINGGTSTPAVLVDHREGDVVDNTGKEVSPDTGASNAKLRYRKILYNSNSNKTEVQVDTKGNILCSLPDDAESGMWLKIPAGGFKGKVGKDSLWEIDGKYEVRSQKEMRMASQKTAKFIGSEVRLGTDNANEPVLLGTTYKNAESQMVDTLSNMENASGLAYTTAIGSLEGFTAAVESSNALPFVPGAIFANVIMGLIT